MTSLSPADLQQARRDAAERFFLVGMSYLPEGWSFKYRKALSGHAFLGRKRIEAPRPVTRKALYIWLHKCAYAHLHVDSRKARHVEEYEAETFAHETMHKHGIPVPKVMTERAMRYVRRKILHQRSTQMTPRVPQVLDEVVAAIGDNRRRGYDPESLIDDLASQAEAARLAQQQPIPVPDEGMGDWPVQQPLDQIRTGYGHAAAVRTRMVVTGIEDIHVLVDYLTRSQHDLLTASLCGLAQREIDRGDVAVHGVTVEEQAVIVDEVGARPDNT